MPRGHPRSRPPRTLTRVEDIREQLAEARARGVSFDRAWREALADCDPFTASMLSRRAWKAAYRREAVPEHAAHAAEAARVLAPTD